MIISEFDLVFLSYDEPNAEKNFALLLNICPWAKRVHGIKGFDAAHRACAAESETEWFVTVDADNIVRPEFFDLNINMDNVSNTKCFSWNALNALNGLSYGNGGLKLWRKSFVETMNTHENADDPRKSVDFCWENGYEQMNQTFSDVWINGDPYQAFRVGFREGVKLTLNRGERVPAEMMSSILHPFNIRNLKIWTTVGAHIENGIWANYGARLGWSHMCDMTWDHTIVRDYDWFDTMWNIRKTYDVSDIIKQSIELGQYLSKMTKIKIPMLSAEESQFFREVLI